jgi:prepilin-type N-terminal cleavage/methylation domain-containing protein/prepilin-type processing-associated H-X9-DG protein
MIQPSKHRAGFTLPEMLTVIAIVLIVIGMLLPGLSESKKAANQAICANNLHQIYLAYRSQKSDIATKPMKSAFGWQGKLLPYMSDVTKMTICPSDNGDGMSGTMSSSLIVEARSGTSVRASMDLEAGPFTRRVDAHTTDAEIDSMWGGNGGWAKNTRNNANLGEHSYLLFFEDIRTGGGDMDHNDLVLMVTESDYGVEIEFISESAGYKFFLMERTGKVIWEDMDNSGKTQPGATYMMDGSPSSYGMNTALPLLQKRSSGSSKIFMLDYLRSVAEGGHNGLDPWNDWMNDQGVLKFARHHGRCNISFFDGHVKINDPEDIDPKIAEYRDDLWIISPD